MVECWSPKPAAKVRFLPLLQRVADSDLPVMCFWPHRLSVRTSGSHPEKRGSIPLEATNCDSLTKNVEESSNTYDSFGVPLSMFS